MVMRVVGECLINTGAVSNLPINAADVSDLYSIQFEVVQGTPAAGTTAVSVIPKNGTSEALLDEFGTAININPTALSGLKISDTPLKSITFTPSNWSAGVSIKATAWGRL